MSLDTASLHDTRLQIFYTCMTCVRAKNMKWFGYGLSTVVSCARVFMSNVVMLRGNV